MKLILSSPSLELRQFLYVIDPDYEIYFPDLTSIKSNVKPSSSWANSTVSIFHRTCLHYCSRNRIYLTQGAP